ncbi:MAG TPA: phosphotransferase family protein [Microthrixaceae bacterium]|nr:phosphotransferase family protein [Microthrixaceae bacterium]
MSDLEPAVTGWIEQTTGGQLRSVDQVTSGGRLGYAVDVDRDGRTIELFLQRGRTGWSAGGSFLDLEREAEVYRALRTLELPVPNLWGADNALNVLLVDRMAGSGWFQMPRDPEEARSIAKDFVSYLARWHRVPARELDLPSFAPIRSIAEHQRDQVADIRAAFEAEDQRMPIDALGRLMLDILENRMPDHDGEPVLLQGDTGPGNLLHAGGKVTAILDWELAHVGDPMDDIAWLSWRATQHGFPDFPERMREYEAASGHAVDPARVAYYRVNAVARLGPRFGISEMGAPDLVRAAVAAASAGSDAAIDRNADGSWSVMSMLHRRMRLEAIAAAIGLELPGRDVEGEDAPPAHADLFDRVLGQLQSIVGRADDRAVAALAKGAARNVKYLKELDRNGRRYDARELEDIAALLATPPSSLDDARAALAAAARAGDVTIEDYLLYQWRRMVHDDHLLRTASGALYERSWPSVT